MYCFIYNSICIDLTSKDRIRTLNEQTVVGLSKIPRNTYSFVIAYNFFWFFHRLTLSHKTCIPEWTDLFLNVYLHHKNKYQNRVSSFSHVHRIKARGLWMVQFIQKCFPQDSRCAELKFILRRNSHMNKILLLIPTFSKTMWRTHLGCSRMWVKLSEQLFEAFITSPFQKIGC